jgi:hypothetical protein
MSTENKAMEPQSTESKTMAAKKMTKKTMAKKLAGPTRTKRMQCASCHKLCIAKGMKRCAGWIGKKGLASKQFVDFQPKLPTDLKTIQRSIFVICQTIRPTMPVNLMSLEKISILPFTAHVHVGH